MRVLTTRLLLAAVLLLIFAPAQGQWDLSGAAEITLRLEKLNVLGSVLMIAAHPDDENNPLLAYTSREGEKRAQHTYRRRAARVGKT
jgi:hypothetical protein